MTAFGNSPMRRRLLEPLDRRHLVFLDIEASGLGPDTWPIELGLARVGADDAISIEDHLIRLDPSWSMRHWSVASAQIHGIPRSALDTAPEAREIASAAIEQLSGMVVVSNAPEFDERWLLTLTRTVDRDLVLPIHDFDAILAASCDRAGLMRAYAALDRLPRPHRAGEDAARLARAWLVGVAE